MGHPPLINIHQVKALNHSIFHLFGSKQGYVEIGVILDSAAREGPKLASLPLN